MQVLIFINICIHIGTHTHTRTNIVSCLCAHILSDIFLTGIFFMYFITFHLNIVAISFCLLSSTDTPNYVNRKTRTQKKSTIFFPYTFHWIHLIKYRKGLSLFLCVEFFINIQNIFHPGWYLSVCFTYSHTSHLYWKYKEKEMRSIVFHYFILICQFIFISRFYNKVSNIEVKTSITFYSTPFVCFKIYFNLLIRKGIFHLFFCNTFSVKHAGVEIYTGNQIWPNTRKPTVHVTYL